MAATVTNDFSQIDPADSATNWVNWGDGTSVGVNNDVFKEGTGSIAGVLSASMTADGIGGFLFDNGAGLSLTGTHIYIWMNTATPITATRANGGVRIRVENAAQTEFGEWYVGGVENYIGGWKMFVVSADRDFDNATGGITNIASMSDVQFIGGGFRTAQQIMGATDNIFVDEIKTGTGIVVTGGTAGDPATFQDIADDDFTNATGVMTSIAGVFYATGRITIGDPSGTGSVIFNDNDAIVVYEFMPVASDFYEFNVTGNGTGTTDFQLGIPQGTGTSTIGTKGILMQAADAEAKFRFDAADPDIDTFKVYGSTFTRFTDAYMGSLTTDLGTSSTEFELVDSAFVDGYRIFRNLADNITELQLNNTILGSTSDFFGSFIIVDTLDAYGSGWRDIDGYGFTSPNDSITQTLSVQNHNFSASNRWLTVYNNKTWDLLNPIGGPIDETTQNDLRFLGTSGSVVNEKYGLNITVQRPDGTVITDGYAYIYEGLNSQDLVVKALTIADGTIDDSWRYKTFMSGSPLSVTTDGDFALKVYAYTRSPFVASITPNAQFSGAVTLSADGSIVETDRLTAISNGSGILVERHGTGETDPRAMKVMNYDGGSGTLPSAGSTVTGGGSGATGVVVEFIGDNVSGTVVLDTWNGTEFTDNETLSSGAWSALANITDPGDQSNFYEEYTWQIFGNNLSIQAIYEYMTARVAETPLLAIFEQVIEWGEDENAFMLQSGTSGFFTVRTVNLSEGVWVSNTGTGTIAFFTSDNGTTFTPPASVSFTVTGLVTNSEVRIYDANTMTEINGTENSGTSFTHNYIYSGADIDIYVIIHNVDYIWVNLTGLTLSSSDQSIPVQQRFDRNYENP